MPKQKKKSLTKRATESVTQIHSWQIGSDEYHDRVERLRVQMDSQGLDGIVFFHPIRMAWLTGFFHISTERPMAIVVSRKGKIGGLIPLLEQEHFATAVGVDTVEIYPEYPSGGGQHPMLHLGDLLKTMRLNGKGARLGYDNNGYLDINGYEGPLLSEVVAGWVETVNARQIVDQMRAVKSATELQLITESCVWGNLAHRLMQEKLELGRGAIEIGLEASVEASNMMVKALGPDYQQLMSTFGLPASVSFSAGANTVLPHGLSSAGGLQPGDVLVTGAAADVGGYTSELERTMLIGEPSKPFIKHFEAMLLLQQVAFDAIRPGRSFADVENDVSTAFAELGMENAQRHHTGHSIGIDFHEYPFIDKGSADVQVEENMVLTIEPGLYVPGLAGFRHSDTVVVRPHSVERLTTYPRDLDALVVSLK